MSEENIKTKAKSDSNFAPTFVDHYFLQDINCNGYCLINNISIPEKVINLYISYIFLKSRVKKFKHRFYIT